MPNVAETGLPPADPYIQAAGDVAGWLDDLLDLARRRGDGALARLVAAVMDDLGTATAKG